MLAYDYSASSARLDDLPEVPISPHLYVLCERCAGSLRTPRGWILEDRRAIPVVATAPPAEVVVPTPERPPTSARDPETEHDRGGQRQLAFGYTYASWVAIT